MKRRKQIAVAILIGALLLTASLSVCVSGAQAGSSDTDPQLFAGRTLAAAGNTGAFVPSELPFTDVPADATYAQAVAWCYEKGLMQGTSATEFSPDSTLTRAMVVTVLYRAEQEPTVEWSDTFSDVPAGQW